MSILASSTTPVIVQGITGGYARDQARMMMGYGSRIVAGVVPGRGGETIGSVPIYDSVAEVDIGSEEEQLAAVVYVPPPYALEAALESLAAGVRLLVVPTEGMPLHDQMFLRDAAREADAWVVGPNTAGMIVPGETLIGSIGPAYSSAGSVGVISRSGTLTHETVWALTRSGFGQSTSVHIGGDPVIGRNMADYVRLFADDSRTRALVVVGEIGGTMEEEAAEAAEQFEGPIVAFIAGRHAPTERRMGHAGALIRGTRGSSTMKIAALEQAGVEVALSPWAIPAVLQAAGFRP